MSNPTIRDYFAELYVAAMFGDAGWTVYFPKRDFGFDFIASKPVNGNIILRPIQVKGLYPTPGKRNEIFGFRKKLSAIHKDMVLVMPYFQFNSASAPIFVAFIPFDQVKIWTKKGISHGHRCSPAKHQSGKIIQL